MDSLSDPLYKESTMKYETIDKSIKKTTFGNLSELQVWRRYDGSIQADLGDHHAAGKTVGEALERLEIYLMSLTANDVSGEGKP